MDTSSWASSTTNADDLREGVRSLYAALERDPTDADAAFFLGISLMAAGQSEEALRPEPPLQRERSALPDGGDARRGRHLVRGTARRGARLERARACDRPGEQDQPLDARLSLCAAGALCDAATQAPVAAGARATDALHRAAPGAHRGCPGAEEARRWRCWPPWTRRSLDGHHRFHLAEAFAMAGDAPRALALFEQAVDTSFYPHQFFAVVLSVHRAAPRDTASSSGSWPRRRGG